VAGPLLLAHRGHRPAGPENSLRSIVAAFDVCDGAETDVIVTADGFAVLRHDERLADGTPVSTLPLRALRERVHATDDDLPLAASAVDALPAGKTLNLELKVPGAARALRAAPAVLPPGVVLTSFYAAEALEAAALFPSTRVGLLLSRWPVRSVPASPALLSVGYWLLDDVRRRHPSAPMWAWTLDDPEAVRAAAAAGCEAWIGNDVALLRASLHLT
jgi:glycerophosphoryl diester phosphodiesterase